MAVRSPDGCTQPIAALTVSIVGRRRLRRARIGEEQMDPLAAIVIALSLCGIAGAVYAAQREARHHRHLADHHEDYTCGWR